MAGERGSRRFRRTPSTRASADETVQLVHRAVGFDAAAVLGHALAAGQAGFALIALPRVDAIDGQPRFVESLFSHGYFAPASVHFKPVTKLIRSEG